LEGDVTRSDKVAATGGIQVIERAASILRALKPHQQGLSLGEIADRVDLPRSTVQRIVGALMAEGLVTTGPRGRRVLLGPEIADLAQQSRRNVVEVCRLILTELSQATGETADLSVLQGASMIFIDQVPGVHRLRAVSSVGDAFPLTTTANGLACLALLPDDEIMRLTNEEWTRHGIQPDIAAFARRIAETRKRGLAFDLDEHTVGISAAGVAFQDRSGGIYAISVPVPSSRFPEVRELVETTLLKTREHASRLTMGG